MTFVLLEKSSHIGKEVEDLLFQLCRCYTEKNINFLAKSMKQTSSSFK